jgi:hypothetical protein
MIIKVDFNNEETLTQLDRRIELYEAGNHFPPRLFCSQETMFKLSKYKDRFPKLKDIDEYKDADYYISKIVVDNTLPFREIELR